MKKRIFFTLVILLLGIAVGLVMGGRFNFFNPAESQIHSEPAAAPAAAFNIEDAVIKAASTTGRAVVSISTESIARVSGARRFYFNTPFGGESPFSQDEHFRRFFDEFFGATPEREYKQAGLGSGVIIDSSGYILTNEHVINNARKITVTLPDGREFKGEVKGKDTRSDLAVIKINANNLPVAVLGDSDSIKIGQWVVAIGNPFAFGMQNPEPTVTVGVVSAMHRSLGRMLARDRDYNDLIQTDAAINPGNSGGPLVNLKGEVVGINVAIFSTTGGYQGIGFAIPSNSARRVIARLVEGKKISYGWLGVTVQNLTDDLARYFKLKDKNGALVAKVLTGGPADKAGIKEGDAIRGFGGKPVNSVKDLLDAVGKTEAGHKSKVVILREGKELTVDVTVGERPQEQEVDGLESSAESSNWRGIAARDLGADSIERGQMKEMSGVVIADITAGSPAEAAGLIPGDLILEINRHPISNLAEYNKVTAAIKSGEALVRTSRGYFILRQSDQ